MRRKYTIARPAGNRAASASQVLWSFCNTSPAGPYFPWPFEPAALGAGRAYKMAGNERQSGHRQVLSQPDGRSCTGPSRRRLRLSDRLGLLLHDLTQASLASSPAPPGTTLEEFFSLFFSGRPARCEGGVASGSWVL